MEATQATQINVVRIVGNSPFNNLYIMYYPEGRGKMGEKLALIGENGEGVIFQKKETLRNILNEKYPEYEYDIKTVLAYGDEQGAFLVKEMERAVLSYNEGGEFGNVKKIKVVSNESDRESIRWVEA